ncbi:MAG: hypothetical protein F4X36_09960 [Gammaproteobacteria bacterium]|nr:hypothetical protein [Gammaproteobacteria bacterium]
MTIYVSNLADLETHARAVRPDRLISIIQPEFQPPTPNAVSPERHLRVPVHDISEPAPGSVLPERHHVEVIVRFLDDWRAVDSLMVHCLAGVSRSSATALLAHFLTTGDAFASARALRKAAPHAWPNRRIVALADNVLDCRGRLREAVDAMGPASTERLGTLVALPVEG